MPNEKDDFLDSLSPEQRERFQEYDRIVQEMEVEVESVPEDKSPSDIERGYTPDPRDAGKQDLEGQKITTEEAGKALDEEGVEIDPLADYPVKSPLPEQEDKNRDSLDLERDFDRDGC